MSAPERIWAGPDEWVDWGSLKLGDAVFWETPENSSPDDREGLTEYVRADLCDPMKDERVRALKAENARLREAGQAVVDEFPVAAGTAKGIPPDECGYGSIYRLRAALRDLEQG